MARVATNFISLSMAYEASIAVLPASPTWKLQEPNTIGAFGAEITTVAREPISKNRQRRKGTIVDLDSSVEFEVDMTIDAVEDHVENFLFATSTGLIAHPAEVIAATDEYRVVNIGYTVLVGHLVYARGFESEDNNGLFDVDAFAAPVAASKNLAFAGNPADGDTVTIGGVVYSFETGAIDAAYKVDVGASAAATVINLVKAITLTGIAGTDYGAGTLVHPSVTAVDGAGDSVDVTALVAGTAGNSIAIAESSAVLSWAGAATFLSGGTDALISVLDSLIDETPADSENATVEIAGYRGAVGDIQINAGGNLISTVLDFTTLDIMPQQMVWVGGEATLNRFATAANYGWARVVSVAANLIELDKRSATFVVDAGAAKEIDLYFGRFVRNVAVDDADYLERFTQFELSFPDLGGVGIDNYEYALGNLANEVTFDLPLADKAVMNVSYIGTDTESPTSVRKTNAATPRDPVKTTAFNTSADIARLRVTEVDEAGLTTDFKSLQITLGNNVSPEKVLGVLGARFMNAGIFTVDLEGQLLFTSGDVTSAIRENRTVTMDFLIRNDNGGIGVDIASMTLGGGDREFPVNETVLVNITGQAFQDPDLGSSIGITLFPYLPPAA